jgi:hypothetical protein
MWKAYQRKSSIFNINTITTNSYTTGQISHQIHVTITQICNAANNKVDIQDSGLQEYTAIILEVVPVLKPPLEQQHSTVTHKTSILWSTATTMYLVRPLSTNH